MDLVTLTVATDKIDFRCNAGLNDADRTSVVEKIGRLPQTYSEIIRVWVDLEKDTDAEKAAAFVAKGRVDLGGSDLLASVASGDPRLAIDFLCENFVRQLRRRKDPRVRVSLRVPRTPPPVDSAPSPTEGSPSLRTTGKR